MVSVDYSARDKKIITFSRSLVVLVVCSAEELGMMDGEGRPTLDLRKIVSPRQTVQRGVIYPVLINPSLPLIHIWTALLPHS